MPVLQKEISIFPATLLSELPGEPGDRRWWILYTKARQEKAVARDLVGYRVPYYLPIVGKTFHCRGRAIRSHIPLFGGYVFLFGSEEERVRSLTTNRISRVLEVGDQERLLGDLRRLSQVIAANLPLTVEERLTAGDRVRVRLGPMAGVEGIVLRRKGKTRLLVSVDFMQKGVSVEIDGYLLDPI